MKDFPIFLCWFRQSLRLSDQPALSFAAKQGMVMPIYILDDNPDEFSMGSASRVWLHHSLTGLNQSLHGKLNVYRGDPQSILRHLIKHHHIQGIYWDRCYEPSRIAQDTVIKAQLTDMGIDCRSFNGSLLFEPWEIMKKDGSPYQVFTHFYRQCLLKNPRTIIKKPNKLLLLRDNNSLSIEDLHLLPHHPWGKLITAQWQFGETAAHKKLKDFISNKLLGYQKGRDYPAEQHTSLLSPHLHFGEISAHQIWHQIPMKGQDSECFLKELIWREFSYYLLYHFPALPFKNFNHKFDQFPWRKNARLFTLWTQGKTGYPIIDAGMRELWQTGYMHNRVRMIVASFLIKNLNIHWREGEKWFWDCLFDADLASNSASWQWVAGSGADAAPFFRIFNPMTQAEKFDPSGDYIRRFVPELQQLPAPYLFKPWEAPASLLKSAGITLGKTYPRPIVDFKQSRIAALAHNKEALKKNSSPE